MAKRFVRSQNGKYKSLADKSAYLNGSIIFNENESAISAFGKDYVGVSDESLDVKVENGTNSANVQLYANNTMDGTTELAGQVTIKGSDAQGKKIIVTGDASNGQVTLEHETITTTIIPEAGEPTAANLANGDEFQLYMPIEYVNGHVTKLEKKAYKLNIPKPVIPEGFTITPNVTDDEVINVKSQTAGTNGFSLELEHSKTNVNYTSGVESKSVGAGTTTVKVPSISVNEYGHVTGVEDKDITITIPTLPEEGVIYSVTTGSVDGSIAVNGNDVFVKGLEDMAYATVEDKILSLENGQLKSTLTFTKETIDNAEYLIIKGIDGQEIGKVDTAEFVKDGMIESVVMGDDNVLTITWNTDAGKEATTINFTKYIDTFTHYLARNGVKIVEEGDTKYYEADVKSDDKYLEVSNGKLATKGIDDAIADAISKIVIPENTDTTYTFENGTAGSFNVTPLNGTKQNVTVDAEHEVLDSYTLSQGRTESYTVANTDTIVGAIEKLDAACEKLDEAWDWEILA